MYRFFHSVILNRFINAWAASDVTVMIIVTESFRSFDLFSFLFNSFTA